MKQILFFVISVLTALTACTSDREQEGTLTGMQRPIGFDCYLGNTPQTRAYQGNMTTDELKQTGFGVLGYYTENADYTGATKPDFMFNEKIYWKASESKWDYDTKQYWPNGQNNKLSFFAYAPYVAAGESEGITSLPSNTTAVEPVIGYKMGTTGNVDLLWGVNEDGNAYGTSSYKMNVNMTKQAISDRIHFTFKHALANVAGSQGCLKVLLDVDALQGSITEGAGTGFDPTNTKVTLKSVTISNATGSKAPVTSGSLNLATGKWTLGSETGSFSYTFSTATAGLLNSDIAEPVSVASWSSISSQKGITLTAQDVISSDAAAGIPLIVFIPGQAPDITVTSEYYIRTRDPKLDQGFSELHQVITNDVTLPMLQSNSRYTLYLHLGLTSVKFSAAVDSWDTTNGTHEQPVDLPANEQ